MSEQPIKLTDEVLGGIRDILHRSQLTTKNAELYFAAIRALRDRAKRLEQSATTVPKGFHDYTVVDPIALDALREVLP